MTLLWGFLWGVAGMTVIAVGAILGVWWERKVAARIQMRYGPQQIGPFGSLQMIADVPKLLFKEDIIPDSADKPIFKYAPLFVFGPIAVSMVVIPFSAGWAPLNTSVGVLFFLAVPSIEVIAILLSAWASHNTLSTLGGIRATAQMISYEVPRSLAVLAIVLLAGSLRPLDVVDAWRWWWLPLTFIAFLIYFIASIAEMNRGPFDIPEAESELVAGYFADYSGMRWASFMMAEYGGMISASLFGAALFLGAGWPFTGALGVVALIVKTIALMTIVMWVKWTLPRLRQDHLMSFCWKVLTPLALVQLVIVGVVLPWL
ncbi:MAG: NADH-quinone oxidoreductase subunit NuoH [Actinobacteria bacterium HGW-Actinobacteria-6]|nr:MAG: NADH-quinone oxidoreductase subunit NuoH [Actinobacteria bacterium HGW-Actinobacteria-6]